MSRSGASVNHNGLLFAAVVIAACSPATPRSEREKPLTMVETLPPRDSLPASSPFGMAAPNMDAANRMIGCYALTLGPWSNPKAHGGTVPAPERVDLTTEWHQRIYIGFR